MPDYPRRDRALIQAASVCKVCRTAEASVRRPSPAENFIDRLNQAVESLRQAINDQTVAKALRSGASAQISETMNEAMTDLQRVESIVRNTLRDDRSARRVARCTPRDQGRASKAAKPRPRGASGPSFIQPGAQLPVK